MRDIKKSVPEFFAKKDFLLSIFKMDLDYIYNPVFDNNKELYEIINHKFFFDSLNIELECNRVLQNNCESEKIVLSSKEERILFLQYNFARMEISKLFKIATYFRRLTVKEANDAVKLGKILKRAKTCSNSLSKLLPSFIWSI